MITPTHIQPEWYFLYAYAILRSIPNRLGGVLVLVLRILVLFFRLVFSSERRVYRFSKKKYFYNFILFHCFFILTWIGMEQVEFPFNFLGQVYGFLYFIFIFLS
jgi:ubiquinol-cytochrome c reductase cytochrome b subunit